MIRIRLAESKLHKIINESIYKIIREGRSTPNTIDMCIKLGIDPNEIARCLFNNGIDAYQFTHEIEDVYEMLQSDAQSNNTPKMLLANAIKKSSDFDDTSEQYGCEAGDAILTKPIGKFGITRLGYILKNGDVEFYGFRPSDGEWFDDIEFGEEQIPQIISLIR